jgi:hypothetical protein
MVFQNETMTNSMSLLQSSPVFVLILYLRNNNAIFQAAKAAKEARDTQSPSIEV